MFTQLFSYMDRDMNKYIQYSLSVAHTHNCSTSWCRTLNVGTVSQLVFLQLQRVSSMLVCVAVYASYSQSCTHTASLAMLSGHLPHSIGTLGHHFRWSYGQEDQNTKRIVAPCTHSTNLFTHFKLVGYNLLPAVVANNHSKRTVYIDMTVQLLCRHQLIASRVGALQWLVFAVPTMALKMR